MNKQEALARLSALEAETAALREIIEAPEPMPETSLLPASWSGNKRYVISSNCEGDLRWDGPYFNEPEGQNFFDTLEEAQAWADAISTLIELRRQPGTEVPNALKEQTTIDYDGNKISYQRWWAGDSNQSVKFSRSSPCFKTAGYARAAVEKIGETRLKQMFNTFHGV